MKAGIVFLFCLASFLGAFLLFSVQPMIGKMALPELGGTPAVWNTCLVYFQGMLLGGYLVAHGIASNLAMRQGRLFACCLVALAALWGVGYAMQPVELESALRHRLASDAQPALVLLTALLRSATVPLVLIAATAPLLQAWFARTGHPRSSDPYFLYAASNAGSLLGLLAYPFLVEPNLGVAAQSRAWRAGFLAQACLIVACGVAAWLLARSSTTGDPAASPGRKTNLLGDSMRGGPRGIAARLPRWFILVFVPSSWLLGVTTYLTTDLAPVPLLWIIPLALYLLSFILAFAHVTAGMGRAAQALLPYLLVPWVLVMSAGFVHAAWVPLHLAAFFVGALACHSALAQTRPPAADATTFYLTIALAGLCGGIFNALVSPLVFNRIVEYPLAVVLACLVAFPCDLRFRQHGLKIWLGDLLMSATVFLVVAVLATNRAGVADSKLGVLGVMLASGLGLYACVTVRRRPVRFALVVAAVLAATGLAPGPAGRLVYIARSFFGVLRVTHDAERNVNRLFHGSTLHGQQSLDPLLRREPSTYFTRSGPIGQLLGAIEQRLAQPGARVAIVGLGAGTLAAYARPGQRWTFYEIDPLVERIARDPRFFTYLKDCQADSVEVVLGDARLRFRNAPDHVYQLIVLDAFSSDSLPVHLFSREAIALYRAKLAPGGVLAFNLSNRYLDLDPVMSRQAEDAGLFYRACHDLRRSDAEKHAGKQPSIWAVMAAAEQDLGGLETDARWQRSTPRPRSRVWTDDYSDLASYLILMPGRLWGRQDKRS
ncbi:MAG: fused MFS/spermidine synthase [Isosphaeraceae bacterium]